jgi:hypothetical protein
MPSHGGHGGHHAGHSGIGHGGIGHGGIGGHSAIGAHSMVTHHHHGGGGGGGGGVSRLLWRSPAQIAYATAISSAEATLAPPACDQALMRLGGVLAFVTLPLTAALLGAPWLKLDSVVPSKTTWDGRASVCAPSGGRRQAGFLK